MDGQIRVYDEWMNICIPHEILVLTAHAQSHSFTCSYQVMLAA